MSSKGIDTCERIQTYLVVLIICWLIVALFKKDLSAPTFFASVVVGTGIFACLLESIKESRGEIDIPKARIATLENKLLESVEGHVND